MKKILSILFAISLTTGALAQTVAKKKAQVDKVKDQKQLENNIAAKKDEKQEATTDLKHLNVKGAVKERKDVRADRKIVHRHAKHLRKYHKVKHPIRKAQRALKVDKDIKSDKH